MDSLYGLFVEIITECYFKYIAGVRLEGSSLIQPKQRQLMEHIYGKKEGFFFIWDFMLKYKFSEYFVGPRYYVNRKPYDHDRELESDMDSKLIEKIKPVMDKPLYDTSLISDEERERVLHFVDVVQKGEAQITGLDLEYQQKSA